MKKVTLNLMLKNSFIQVKWLSGNGTIVEIQRIKINFGKETIITIKLLQILLTKKYMFINAKMTHWVMEVRVAHLNKILRIELVTNISINR